MSSAAACKQLSLLDSSISEQNGICEPAKESLPEESPAKNSVIVPDSRTIENLEDHYKIHLISINVSHHTVGSFISDIRRLGIFLKGITIDQVSKMELEDFLAHERDDEEKSETTVYRCCTAIRNYFKWLESCKFITTNPAEKLIYKRAKSPLPEILTRNEGDRFIESARLTPQEHVIALLLLGGGIKRNELLQLELDDIDIRDRFSPKAIIHSDHKFKNRVILLPLEFVEAYREYLARTRLRGLTLIDWTGSPDDLPLNNQITRKDPVFLLAERKVNYVVEQIAGRAGITKNVSCQMLRDSCAVLHLRAGKKMDDVFDLLGLSQKECNIGIRQKYKKLAEIKPL